MKFILVLPLLLLLFPGAHARADEWADAERRIVHLSPTAFPDLPMQISRYLVRHGYTIPQCYDVPQPHNAVRGNFRRHGQEDWAILASRRGASAILVFWGGSTRTIAHLAGRPDRVYLQTVGGGRIGYSRILSVVGRQYVLDHYHAYGGPEPPPIDHDAINDGFAEKASTVYYYDGQRWHQLQGAD